LQLPREEEVEVPLHVAEDADEAARKSELVDGDDGSVIGCATVNDLWSLFCDSLGGDSW
jgi:hypothetical protein